MAMNFNATEALLVLTGLLLACAGRLDAAEPGSASPTELLTKARAARQAGDYALARQLFASASRAASLSTI